MMRCHCRQRRVSTKLPPPPSWLPPALHCHLHAAATYAAATLPPLRRRRLHTAANIAFISSIIVVAIIVTIPFIIAVTAFC